MVPPSVVSSAESTSASGSSKSTSETPYSGGPCSNRPVLLACITISIVIAVVVILGFAFLYPFQGHIAADTTSLISGEGVPTTGIRTGNAVDEAITTEIPVEKSSITGIPPELNSVLRTYDNVYKSDRDKSEYKGVELNNGMKIMVISNTEVKMAAAALCLQVGSMSSPPDILGLAHLVEHMIFKGSTKYPGSLDYVDFLTHHGNSIPNAVTEADHTCFHFKVFPDHLEGAVDILVEAFNDPLMRSEDIDTEIKAIVNEYESNLNNEYYLLRLIEKSTYGLHEFGKFDVGNNETLHRIPVEKGINVRTAAVEFFNKFYSANLMSVAVVGSQSLARLTAMASKKFSGIPSRNATLPTWHDHPMSSPHAQGILMKMVSIEDGDMMYISFPLPDLKKDYRSKAETYLTQLINREGEGTFSSVITERGLSYGCYASIDSFRGFAFLRLSILLTSKDREVIDNVLLLFFKFVAFLRAKGPQSDFYKEHETARQMSFITRPPQLNQEYALSVSKSVWNYSWKDALSGDILMAEYHPDRIKLLIDMLRPEKMSVTLSSKTFGNEVNLTERFTGTKYSMEKLSAARVSDWAIAEGDDELFKLPPRNIFLASVDDAIAVPDEKIYQGHPVTLINETSHHVMFMQDTRGADVGIKIEFRSPIIYESTLTSLLTILNSGYLVRQQLKAFDGGRLAGFKVSIVTKYEGVELHLHGYRQQSLRWLGDVINKLLEFNVSPEAFETLKQGSRQSLANADADAPFEQVLLTLDIVLGEKKRLPRELLALLQETTFQQLKEFHERFFKKVFTRVFVHGNARSCDALSALNTTITFLKSEPLSYKEVPALREFHLHEGVVYRFGAANRMTSQNAVLIYYQAGCWDTHLAALISLYANIVSPLAFKRLREVEGIAYHLDAHMRVTRGTLGFVIRAQSGKTALDTEQSIRHFMEAVVENYIANMTSATFHIEKESLITGKVQQAKTVERYWDEIVSATFMFDKDEQILGELVTISKGDLMAFHKRYISNSSSSRQLVITSQLETGEPHKRNNTYYIKDLSAFREEHTLL